MRTDFKLSHAQREDARRALRIIGSKNVTLEDCAKIALAIETTESVKTSMTEAVDQFLRAILKRGRREATYRFYYERLRWFTGCFDGSLDDWNRARLKGALEKMDAGATTIRMTYRAVRALYGFAMQQNPPLARANPCVGLKLDLPATERNVRFFSVEDVSAILKALDRSLKPAACFLFFAGLRPEEIAPRSVKPRLQWEHVNFDGRFIRVPGDVAKVSGVPRVIENLPDTLWRHIPQGRAGPICGFTADWLIGSMRRALAKPWIQDVTRHTFATYAMAREDNASRVSGWLGHEGDLGVFHRHYKGHVTAAAALRYWSI